MVSSSDDGRMIRRAAREVQSGMIVNLGIGLPGHITGFLNDGLDVCLHSENGIAGVGPIVPIDHADRNLIDAGGNYVSTVSGASFFDSAVSFAMVRSGRVDLSVLGALQVGTNGDLANWAVPERFTPGPGGATELAQKARRVIALTRHQDKHGHSKLVEHCSLPLTAPTCVDRIITDLAVIDIVDGHFVLRELAGETPVGAVLDATDAPVEISQTPLSTF